MIKSIGLGKRNPGMSHEESCNYHRDRHAPMAKRLLGPRGLTKYVGYYVDQGFTLSGEPLPELPCDRVVFEWLTEELWGQMWEWRKTNPDGIEVAADEGRYGDRNAGVMLLCQEQVFIGPQQDGGVNIVHLARKKTGMTRAEFLEYHREQHAPAVVRTLGRRLKKYIAYYPEQALSMADGVMPAPPYDVVVSVRLDKEIWDGVLASWEHREDAEMAKDELRCVDPEHSYTLVCNENVFI